MENISYIITISGQPEIDLPCQSVLVRDLLLVQRFFCTKSQSHLWSTSGVFHSGPRLGLGRLSCRFLLLFQGISFPHTVQ